MSGLLINDLSDHKMILMLHKNNTYIEKVNKFVEMCGVEGKRRLCDLTSSSPALATRHYQLCAVGQ